MSRGFTHKQINKDILPFDSLFLCGYGLEWEVFVFRYGWFVSFLLFGFVALAIFATFIGSAIVGR